jgi:hypothetical protein
MKSLVLTFSLIKKLCLDLGPDCMNLNFEPFKSLNKYEDNNESVKIFLVNLVNLKYFG